MDNTFFIGCFIQSSDPVKRFEIFGIFLLYGTIDTYYQSEVLEKFCSDKVIFKPIIYLKRENTNFYKSNLSVKPLIRYDFFSRKKFSKQFFVTNTVIKKK